jgi:hypothetical protein
MHPMQLACDFLDETFLPDMGAVTRIQQSQIEHNMGGGSDLLNAQRS